MNVKKKDFIVGLFVTTAILVLAGVSMMLRHWDIFNTRNTYFVKFDQVRQLDVGSPVLAYGIVVGTVSHLEYVGPPHPIEVTIRVDKQVDIFSNAAVRVIPAQVIGTTTLNIDDIGTLTQASHLLKPREVIVGLEQHSMDTVMTEALQGISTLLSDEDTQKAFKETMVNLDSVTNRMDETFMKINEQFVPLVTELKASSVNLNRLLLDSRTDINRAADSITTAGQAFQAASNEYARTGRMLSQEVQKLSVKLQSVADQLQQTVQTNQKPLTETLAELRDTSRALREVIERVNRGDGTLGMLINDPRPFKDLQQLIDSITRRLTGGGAGATSVFPQVQSTPGGPDRKRP